MKTRCKLRCSEVNLHEGQEGIKLNAVTSGSDDEENKSFSKFTPFAEFQMTITNEELFGFFKPGKSYYFDIIEAQEPKE